MAFSLSVQATTPKTTIIFHQDEILDKEELLNRSKLGISDINENIISLDATLVNANTKASIPVYTYSATQLLKIEETKGFRTEHYATTGYLLTDDAGHYYDYEWDSSYAIKAYGTIYWNKTYDPNGVAYYDLEKVDGGWHIADGTCTLSNRDVVLLQSGWVYGSGYREYRTVKYPSRMTYTYDAPSNWEPVSDSAQYLVGQRSYTKINRGSHSWDLYLEVYLKG